MTWFEIFLNFFVFPYLGVVRCLTSFISIVAGKWLLFGAVH